MNETIKTAAFVVTAVALAIAAAVVSPESAAPEIMSDQGEPFYPAFKDPQAVKTIEVVDYDEATATARPFQVALHNGRWVLPSHHDYPVESGDRLVKTAAALVDLSKDLVRSDSPSEHGKYGVIDPLDQKVPELTGRGKRVTLRDARKDVLADYILGRAVEGKAGFRYVRLPGQKRVYAAKTEADPSARFADWVDSGLLRISAASIRKVTVYGYSIDERMGIVGSDDRVTLVREGARWTVEGGGRPKEAAVNALASTLDNLKIVDVRPKPASLAQDLKSGKLELSIEMALALRQRGFFVAPTGRLYADEGETVVETANGVAYVLRFGEVAAPGAESKTAGGAGENRYLFVTVSHDPKRAATYGGASGAGERMARDLTNRFAGWFYVIGAGDFQKLRPRKADLTR